MPLPDTPLLFGLAAGAISALAYLPYVYATLTGRCRPQRASWLIWLVLGSVALFGQIVEGAGASLWFAAIQVAGAALVVLLSVRHGAGGFLSRGDRIVLALSALGLLTYFFTETAAYALAITISISSLGGMATVVKAFHFPNSETVSTWAANAGASLCALLAVGAPDALLLAYPLYMLVMNGAVVLAIYLGRNRRNRGGLTGGFAA